MDPIPPNPRITLDSPIFGNSSTRDPRITETLIAAINRSPLLVEWIDKYNDAIRNGTHVPITDGEGQYFRPGERGNDPSGNALPGGLRIPMDRQA